MFGHLHFGLVEYINKLLINRLGLKEIAGGIAEMVYRAVLGCCTLHLSHHLSDVHLHHETSPLPFTYFIKTLMRERPAGRCTTGSAA